MDAQAEISGVLLRESALSGPGAGAYGWIGSVWLSVLLVAAVAALCLANLKCGVVCTGAARKIFETMDKPYNKKHYAPQTIDQNGLGVHITAV